MNDFGSDAFLVLLNEGSKGPGPKTEALEALSLRQVWVATWEPRAEGFRTLINAGGEEALAVFSSERELEAAAKRFDWLEPDGTIAKHRAIGGDILRHAWSREYGFVVVDIASDHTLEYDRAELKQILRDLDSTGPFRTSRPPAAPHPKGTAASSFPPPRERPLDAASTVYSMAPRREERLDRLSELPTKPHQALQESEPPTRPRASVAEASTAPSKRASSQPVRKTKNEPAVTSVEEIRKEDAEPTETGTYGAASMIPDARRRDPFATSHRSTDEEAVASDSIPPFPSSAPRQLNSDAPTAPGASSVEPGKLELPAIGPIGKGPIEPSPPSEPERREVVRQPATMEPPRGKSAPRKAAKPPRIAPTSIGDGIRLLELLEEPDDALLAGLSRVMRGYFEIEWASYCQVARPAGPPGPAVALRITDDYRDNVTAIIKDLCAVGRNHDTEIEVLLIDGHDMLRKARENAFVFYPWKPKPFGA